VAKPDRSLPIAVFDSGVGGLTVLHECLVSLPHEDFVYLGDTARFPYGDRPPRQIEEFALELAGRLVADGAKLLVVACNAATSAALPALRRELEGRVPVVGVIGPESRVAAAATRNGRLGLLATPATVASGAYERALAAAAPEATLTPVACAELAALIQEGGALQGDLLEEATLRAYERVVDSVERGCAPLKAAGADTVILGCTHYPLVRPIIQRSMGRGVAIAESGQAIADDVEEALRARGLEADPDRRGEYRFVCSGDPDEFRRLGTRFLQMPLGEVRGVDVAEAAA
jgi:glutamate racemase